MRSGILPKAVVGKQVILQMIKHCFYLHFTQGLTVFGIRILLTSLYFAMILTHLLYC